MAIRRAIEWVREHPWVVLIVVGVAAFALHAMIAEVGAGEVAVVVDPVTHSISKPVIGPAFFIKLPWQYVIKDRYAVEVVELVREEKSAGEWVFSAPTVLTKDGVTVTVEVVIRYRIRPERFDELVRMFPSVDYDDKVLVPKARQLIRDIISKVSLDYLPHRE